MKYAKIGSTHGVHCAGCRWSFEYYGMTAEEGHKQGGKIYCNPDCALESETAEIERNEWDALSDDY